MYIFALKLARQNCAFVLKYGQKELYFITKNSQISVYFTQRIAIYKANLGEHVHISGSCFGWLLEYISATSIAVYCSGEDGFNVLISSHHLKCQKIHHYCWSPEMHLNILTKWGVWCKFTRQTAAVAFIILYSSQCSHGNTGADFLAESLKWPYSYMYMLLYHLHTLISFWIKLLSSLHGNTQIGCSRKLAFIKERCFRSFHHFCTKTMFYMK